MKKIYLFAIATLFAGNLLAQAPEQMTYQAVVRDASNSLLANQQLGMQISILQGSVNGTAVYVETATPTTNANGLVTVEIGAGTVVSGDFSTIDWGNGPYFIKTETDPAGGTNYSITGTSGLLSVPYALHAKTAETITGTYNETDPIYAASVAAGITGADTMAWNNKLDAELDGDPTNEIELPMGGNNGQVLQTDGSGTYTWVDQTVLNEAAVDMFVSNNGYITSPNDADADPTNEIELPIGGSNGQVLQTNGSGTYTWVNQTVDTQLDETAVDAFVANNGYITSPNDADSDPTNEIEIPPGGLNGYVLQTNGSGVYSWTPQTVNTDTQLDETAVDAFVANNGYITSPNDADADPTNEIELPNGGNNGDILATDGAGNYTWIAPAGGAETDPIYGASPAAGISAADILNWNSKLSAEVDGDPTNEIELPAGGSNGQVLQTDGAGNYSWVNQTINTDTQLDETAVDAFVANNGYITNADDADADPTNEIELPNGGNNGDMLVTDGAGNYSWTAPAAGGGSSGNDFYLGQDTLGGVVFHIYEDENGDQHGLIVSLGDHGYANMQSSTTTLAGNTSWDGKSNYDVLRATGSTGCDFIHTTATLNNNDVNGPWYLPSIDELILLYQNRFHANKGLASAGGLQLFYNDGFNNIYWSSTQSSAAGNGMNLDFFDGTVSQATKTGLSRIRAIRAF